MKSCRMLMFLTLPSWLLLNPGAASAGPVFSDSVYDVVWLGKNPHPTTFGGLTETDEAAGATVKVTIPSRTIDFFDADPAGRTVSDRVIIHTYDVQLTSDVSEKVGLAPRPNAIKIQNRELFPALGVSFASDNNGPNRDSDAVVIAVPASAPGTGTIIPESGEMPFTAQVLPVQFDLYEGDGTVSDYFDIITPVVVDFISDPALIDPTVKPDFTLDEPDVLHYFLWAQSDAVPEPASCILLSMGLAVLGGYVAWKRPLGKVQKC